MAEFDDPTLEDPDAEGDTRYNWDEEFQRHVISLLISDRQFLLQSVDLVKPNYFTNKAHSKVCSLAFDYFKKYRFLPKKDFIVQELKSELKENKSLPYYLGEVNVLFDYFQPGLEAREYLQDKITYFAKIQSLKEAFKKSLEEIDRSPESETTWSKVYGMMQDAMSVTHNHDMGLDYFRSVRDRYAKKREDIDSNEYFITGLNGIDIETGGGGYKRGQMISIVAGSGVGKSVMLACLTATNLLRGKKGLYISLEIDESMVADRMDAILTEFPIQALCARENDVFDKLASFGGVQYEGQTGPYIIKQFPPGQATVNTIRAYVAQLRFQGFDPDFVIIDYVGEMQDYPDMKTYESRERLVRDLRGMAVEENIFVATAMQPNRDFKKEQKGAAQRIDDQHLADAFGQIRPLDGCFSLNQNDNEKQLGIGRCYVIKQRDGKSRYQIYLRFNKENLKITEITQQEYMQILNAHSEYVSEETKIDMVKANSKFKPSEEEPTVDDIVGGDGFESFKEASQSEE